MSERSYVAEVEVKVRMRNMLMIVAGVFLILLLGYEGLSFLGETAEEVMTPVELAKDFTGLVLALSVLYFCFTSRDTRIT
jgi:hypothetical protein